MASNGVCAVVATALALLLAGCATHPPSAPFPVSLPAAVPEPSKPIAVIGDLQNTSPFVRTVMRRESNDAEQAFLLADLQRRAGSIGALLITGDLVFTARSASDWRRFDRLVAPIARRVPILPAIGNHDYHCFFVQKCLHGQVPRNFRARFPWFAPGQPYVVNYGDIALVFLDSEVDLDSQGRWLCERLVEWEPTYRAALIFLHRPPFTSSAIRGAAPDENVRAHIIPRLAASRLVSAVFSGHVHGYEHIAIDGRHYVTTAGGGGPRGLLEAERPGDVYGGRDCRREADGRVLRPFNYVLVQARTAQIDVTVHGFCRGDAAIEVLESFSIPLPGGADPSRE
jgi:hypothetical protein